MSLILIPKRVQETLTFLNPTTEEPSHTINEISILQINIEKHNTKITTLRSLLKKHHIVLLSETRFKPNTLPQLQKDLWKTENQKKNQINYVNT